MDVRTGIALVLLLGAGLPAAAQLPATPAAMYGEWCAVCHGEDGAGRPSSRPVKTEPIDFTDCRLTTPETDADWELVITHGGPAAGRSSDMPGFEMLGREAILDLVRYTKTFCRDERWPSGNLNFPRAIFTKKAFPEDEAILQPVVSHGREANVRTGTDLVYARRVGRRSQVEIAVPAESVDAFTGLKIGFGDLRLEAKHVLYADATRPMIVSAGLEASLPTGSRRWGFGEGTTVFEPFAAIGAAWRDWFIQGELRGLLPTKRFPIEPVRHVRYGVAFLRPLSASPVGWTLGAELNGTDSNVSVTPQLQKGLTRTGSLIAAFGVRLSLTPPLPYKYDVTRWSGFLLWDFREPLRARP